MTLGIHSSSLSSRPGKRLTPFLFALAIFLCGSLLRPTLSLAQPPTPLRIAAAADLQPVLPPILAEFERQTAIHAEATYQASAALTTQIQNGAPFDLFLSADTSYPTRLIAAGLADSTTPTHNAPGTHLRRTRSDSHWPTPTLATLRDPALQRLAIANPDRAPYGKAAISAIARLRLADILRPKLVSAENISQAAQFAETGNAEAGLISLTSAMTPHLRAIGSWFVLPRDLYPPIEQAGVVLASSKQRTQAHRFLDFLLSAPVQQTLATSGLTPVR
jgi:molybdate transport system substrate-binding protein